MLFTNYKFYSETYGGTSIPSNIFARVSTRASYFINQITFSRINDDNKTNDIQFATCAVADEMYKIEKDGGVKASESVGNHSVSYANQNSSEEKKYYNVAKIYLQEELLYRGAY